MYDFRDFGNRDFYCFWNLAVQETGILRVLVWRQAAGKGAIQPGILLLIPCGNRKILAFVQ